MRTFLLVCILPVAFGIMSHSGGGWGGGSILSRRQTTIVSKRQTIGNGKIYKMIKATLERARQGISVKDLAEAADEVGEAVATIIDAHGGKVSAQEVYDIIEEIASGSDVGTALSALFDDALTYEGNLMECALNLWNRLADKEEELEEDGKSSEPVLAAISMTAQSIRGIVKNSVRIVTDSNDDEEENNRQKRKEFILNRNLKANVDMNPNGMGGANIKGVLSHTSGPLTVKGKVEYDTHRSNKYSTGFDYDLGNGASFGGNVDWGKSNKYSTGFDYDLGKGASFGGNVNWGRGETSVDVGLTYTFGG